MGELVYINDDRFSVEHHLRTRTRAAAARDGGEDIAKVSIMYCT